MQLIEVVDKKTAKDFILVNVELNKNNSAYIRPLDKDIHEVFDKKKNKTFRSGDATRWILKDEDGKLIGRIAAFVNKKYKNKGDDVPVGGIGFFDCINDQAAADMLFDVAKHWLMQKGIEAMDGPINFGERDRWWGLVTEGFQEPLYCMNYNPPYYKELFENYGFKIFFHQICFGIDPKKPFNQKLYDRHQQLAGHTGFKAVFINKQKKEKFAADFTSIYNQAWAQHGGTKELRTEQVIAMFKKMKLVMDEKTILFVYHHDKPVAVFLSLPDLNQWFKYLDGKFNLLHKLRFLWIKRTKPNKKLVGIVFGIIPEYQGSGLDAFMIVEQGRELLKKSYTEYEMQWIGDFNPKMINIAENFGETFRTRKLTTYRYLFDRTKEFKPHPVLN